ncbi:DUF3795 domain-containing protein [Methanocella sp. MCL-LM]|uniref:DUF3795 domain-containing protein n=1 Tax=Methanocella sp. MCL-LM TaxID=3412035 RepID=UPI003C779586
MASTKEQSSALVEQLKHYDGVIPSCGVFCGGCPVYVRDRKPCPGASLADRCGRCKTFHLCCAERGITHCYQCETLPCRKFKDFAKRWEKYGQKLIENQILMKSVGPESFLDLWNEKLADI